jgi:hypothetical protein
MITVRYEPKRNGEHLFWVGRHGPHSIRIDANKPGVFRWTITRKSRSVASGVAADRAQAANDAAAALAELPRSPPAVGHTGGTDQGLVKVPGCQV